MQPTSSNQTLAFSGRPIFKRTRSSRGIALDLNNVIGKKRLDLERPGRAIKLSERLSTSDDSPP